MLHKKKKKSYPELLLTGLQIYTAQIGLKELTLKLILTRVGGHGSSSRAPT
jgi:hypothetical protein